MRNLRLIVCLLLLSFIFSSCKEDTPSSNLRITGVFPSSNPIGGPVKIEGIGFGDQVKIFFDGVPAIIEQRSDTLLTTKVPQGINGSGISISVESGGGTDQLSDGFDVLSSYPSNLPSSPPSIFIPPTTSITALPFGINGVKSIWHKNVYEPDHIVVFYFWRQMGFEHLKPFEKITLDSTIYHAGLLTDGKDLLDYNDTTKEVNLSRVDIDRTTTNNGVHPYVSDSYSARYFSFKNFPFPQRFLNEMGNICLTDNFLLLESTKTGRQYLFVVYDTNSNHC